MIFGRRRSNNAHVAIGDHLVTRTQPPVSREQQTVVNQFHDLYYERWHTDGGDTTDLSWMGYGLLKCPMDLWMYQELLVRTRPDVIVETGTLYGGSAYFLASILDLIGHGRVISIDIDPQPNLPTHPRITFITGSSTDAAVVERVKQMVGGERAMVILDSDHHLDHVFGELLAYSPLVQVGDYLVVEDTNINGNPTSAEFGPGPTEAVERFLAIESSVDQARFAVDRTCERFLITYNPGGYLKRVS